MSSFTFRDRCRYRFDNLMSKGPVAMIGGLGILSLALIFIMAFLVYLTGIAPAGDDGSSPGLLDIAWANLMRTLDAGTMGGDTGSWAYLFAMLAVTMGGVFIVSTFIGVLTSGIENRLEELRKGRSFVIEKKHTVILGWSEQIFAILNELIEANSNKRNACIAILADKDKVEMEDEITSKISDSKTTRIVCRSGSPIDLADIDIVNPHDARSIIVLGPETDNPDTHVIKALLAITNHPNRRQEPYHIVSEIRDVKNLEVAKLIAKDEAKLVLVGDLIARIMVQTCRQSGLSVVYTELLDFGGDEIYFHAEPKLAGKTYRDVLFAFEESAIIGIKKSAGPVLLNPDMKTPVEPGDELIAISEDDDTIKISGNHNYNIIESALSTSEKRKPVAEKTLILGWNERGSTVIRELNNYVASGSVITVVSDNDNVAVEVESLRADLKNVTVTFRHGDTTDRSVLEKLDLNQQEHIITLSDGDDPDVQSADAKTLITLLHLRELAQAGKHHASIVSEMLDARNRDLAQVTRADDFIVSDKLVALMLSQLSENRDLDAVFTDLFDPEGSEIYLKPATDYIKAGSNVNFYTILESAARRGETAIGYRIKRDANDAGKSFGVKVNPKKSASITLSEEDKIIVLAED